MRDCDMRVLDLAEFYSERGGGVRSYLDKMLVNGSALGHEVVVVAPGPRDEDTKVSDRGRIVRYRAPRMPYDASYHAPIAVFRMRELVQRFAPDVLQISSPFIPLWVGATLKSVPVRSYVYHSDPIGCYVTPLALRSRAGRALESVAWSYMRRVSAQCDVTVTASDWLAREITSHGCERARAVSFGIDHENFAPERRDEGLRREILGELADNPEARLVLICGRLAADKRQVLLLEALQKLAPQRPLGLFLLGDGPERERLEAMGRSLPRFRAMRFTRDRAEYARILASADALVHASRCETFGFVLAECLASGTPIVGPNAGAATDMLAPAWSETFDTRAEAPEVARAIERLLARPRAELSGAAVARARTLPTTRQHFADLFALYASLMTERSRV
jgi:alpha-1,6-mannosyltransferase